MLFGSLSNKPYPQLAASTIAMQKASVSEVLRKMSPWTSTCKGRSDGQGLIQTVTTVTYIPDLGVIQAAQKVHTVLKLKPLPCLLQQHPLGTIPTCEGRREGVGDHLGGGFRKMPVSDRSRSGHQSGWHTRWEWWLPKGLFLYGKLVCSSQPQSLEDAGHVTQCGHV